LNRRLEVLAPVELDGQPLLRAEEIQNVRTACVLATELEPIEASIPEPRPDGGLGVSRLSSQRATPLERGAHREFFDGTPRTVAAAMAAEGNYDRTPLTLTLSPLPRGEGKQFVAGGGR
jgi:hypothetical protein